MSEASYPVAFPISELVIQNVVETLSGVGTHSSYLNDLIVEEARQEGNGPIRDGLTIVSAGDPEPEVHSPVGHQRYTMTVGVCAYVTESQDSEPHILRGRLYSIAADIRRALNADLHRGGIANWTQFKDKDEVDAQGSPPSVIVWVTVCFDTIFANPYLQ